MTPSTNCIPQSAARLQSSERHDVDRIHPFDGEGRRADATLGTVEWAPVPSLWLGGHLLIALVGGAFTLSWDAVLVFIISTALTLCLGHSLGMHRKLIHDSFACPVWLERVLVYLGVLVGLSGPLGLLRTHELRDWAQRQPQCHPYLRHGTGFWQDAWWQLHCRIRLETPPQIVLEPRLAHDRFLRGLQSTWMLQQLPLAAALWLCGGMPWVIWGISARVSVSVIGHWLVGHFAHNEGGQDHLVQGAAVQGHNVRWAGFISMGEAWHNNHHAFPGSARIGLYPGQPDPGWWVLRGLQRLGLVWNLKLPHDLPARPELIALGRARKNGASSSPTRV